MADKRKRTGISVVALALAATLALALSGCAGGAGLIQKLDSPAVVAAESEIPVAREAKKPDAAHIAKAVKAAARSKSGKVMPNISDAPVKSVFSVEITPELMSQLRSRVNATHKSGVGAPGAMGEFVKANPDFLYNQSGRVMLSGRGKDGSYTVEDGGDHAQLLLWDGAAPDADLLNRKRLSKFVENYKAGVPDRIAVVSAGAPISVWVTVFDYTGKGAAYTVESYSGDLENPRAVQVATLMETDREWLMLSLPDWKIRYPKYGYEPIALSSSGKNISQAQAQRAVETYVKAQYPDAAYAISVTEGQTIGGRSCYMFEALNKSDSFSTIALAVSTNLDRVYEQEQVNGQWMLQARPKSSAVE